MTHHHLPLVRRGKNYFMTLPTNIYTDNDRQLSKIYICKYPLQEDCQGGIYCRVVSAQLSRLSESWQKHSKVKVTVNHVWRLSTFLSLGEALVRTQVKMSVSQ